jgi:hypothetical protein
VYGGKYLQSANNQENYTVSNPALDGNNGRRGPNFQVDVARRFVDRNNNHIPDCNLLVNTPNGECLFADLGNFANPNSLTIVNPAVLSGWGVRPYDWQFGVSVQQEIAPRTSLEVGFARRDFRNFFVYDNINIGPNDFTLSTLTAPTSSKLPNGGGNPVQYYLLNAAAANRPIQNRFTFASDYGDWTNHWNGVDITVNSRLRQGFTLQIGSSTGRAIVDNCGVVAKVPEMLNTALTNPGAFGPAYQLANSCRKEESWQTQVRGFATYIIPKADVLVSGIFRFQPNSMFGFGATPEGNSTGLSANYSLPTGQTVNLLPPGQVFADRINQVDARFGKIINFGNRRANIAIDVLNLFNANTGTAFQQNYGDGSGYLNPTAILNPRFVRFNVTVDF